MNIIINREIFIAPKATLLYCIVVVSLLLLPSIANVHAQTLGTVVTFQESVYSDEEGGNLSFPSFIMADPSTSEVYVIDGKSRITVFTPDFYPNYTLGKRDGIESPQGLAIDDKGYLYIAQSATEKNPKSRISVYSACFKHVRDIYLHGFDGADTFEIFRLAIDRHGNFYVAANYYPGVLYVNSKGRLLEIISPEKEGEKVQISSVALDIKGRIYLVSEELSHVYVYDEERTLLMKFGEKGGSSGKLSRPRGVGIDMKSERKYVIDYMRHTITVYNEKGEYIFEFGGMGWGEGWFQHPSYLTVDKDGRILVADTFNQRIQVFNSW